MNEVALPNPTGASTAIRLLVRLARPLSRAVRLDAPSLMARASRTTGLEDWGPSSFRDGLDRFLAAADGDARLNVVGRIAAHRAVSSSLRNRLRFVQACKDAPEALSAAPRRPLVIAALPRTGSSLLHQLLACHPQALFIPLWLGLQPMPMPDRDEWRAGGSRVRRAGARRVETIVRVLEPAMMTKHPVEADRPVECGYFMMSTFQALQWWTLFPVHDYAEWFEGQDSTEAYKAFRAHLQLVQHRLGGTHWVLKSPGHFLRVDELVEALPDARIVRLHRDPVQVLASTHSLFATAHGLMSNHLDHRRTAAINADALARAAEQAAVSCGRIDPARVLDVLYDDLVARPLDVVRRIHAWADLPHDDVVEQRALAILRAQHRARFGAHRYQVHDLVDVAHTRARFLSYSRRFLEASGDP